MHQLISDRVGTGGFFFFQAEDGIRDVAVTGVQTCALPISFKARAEVLGEQYSQYEPLPGVNVNGELTMGENIADLGGLTRSEERRVGKECRSRWSPYH